jgi:UDP-N-acetyl-D-glucosamine dehydrogenase
MRSHRIELDSVSLTAERLAACDCAVVVTDHRSIDWDLVAAHAPLIIDTRNALAGRVVRGRLLKA